jgi:hypothetical protein
MFDDPVHLTIDGAGSDEIEDYPVRLTSYGASRYTPLSNFIRLETIAISSTGSDILYHRLI